LNGTRRLAAANAVTRLLATQPRIVPKSSGAILAKALLLTPTKILHDPISVRNIVLHRKGM
jgi:hypothetical protein